MCQVTFQPCWWPQPCLWRPKCARNRGSRGDREGPTGTVPRLPAPRPPLQWPGCPQRLLLLPSRGHVPQLHMSAHGWHLDGAVATLGPRQHPRVAPAKQAPILARPHAPWQQRTWPHAAVATAAPWPGVAGGQGVPGPSPSPPKHRPKGAEPLLSPGVPRRRCQSSGGSAAPLAAWEEERGRVHGERWQEGTPSSPFLASDMIPPAPASRRAARPSTPQENPGFIKTHLFQMLKDNSFLPLFLN